MGRTARRIACRRMDLLAFARGPGLVIALAVFVLGAAWRLAAIARLPRRPDRSPARDGAPSPLAAALAANLRAMWPLPAFGPGARWRAVNGWAFHVGLALIVFGYAPHIAFVRRHTGIGWPALPDAVLVVAAAVTIVALLLALAARIADPLRRRISVADDAISWLVTFAPLATGMAVVGEPSSAILAPGHVAYAGPLAAHLLAFELLLVWFPFGKLMHALLFVGSRA